jgi:hypothetical protein
MLVLYILTFVCLFKSNTEYLCSILLLILNIFYLLLFLSDVEVTSTLKLFIFIPIEIPIRFIILIIWSLLIVSNSWFINTIDKLHRKLDNTEKGMDFGSIAISEIKKYVKIFLVCSSILLVLLHVISLQNLQQYIPSIVRVNTVKLVILAGGIMFSSLSIYLNDNLSSITNIITQ